MSSLDVTDLFFQLAKSNGGKLFGLAADTLKHATDILAANFSDYFEDVIRSCTEVHTIFDRSRPLDLRSLYTPMSLTYAGVKVSDKKFRSSILDLPDYDSVRTFLVVGSAGTGKTMLLKHMFIDMIENCSAKLPFYIPLRKYNSFAADLPRFLHKVISNSGAQVDYTIFEREMRSGGFLFLLDGLDEVYPEHRSHLIGHVLGIQAIYSKTTFVISSRPDETMTSWDRARPYHILPMEKRAIVSLIRKIPYRNDFKSRFINDIISELYEKHKSFLSNPLLASIMLLTYSDIGCIPERMHLFYEQAFETLFYRHDTLKEAGFHRHHYCDVPINRFRDCVSAFCISTYNKAYQEFTRSSALDFIRKAAEFERMRIDEEDFLLDMLETVCILQLDGLYIRFTHRSFQEYFAAVFLARNVSVDLKGLLNKCVDRRGDNVISMAVEMNRSVIEREWVIPRLKALTQTMQECGTNVVGVCRGLFGGFGVVGGTSAGNGEVVFQRPTRDGHFLYTVRSLYPDRVSELPSLFTNSDLAKWQEWWIKRYNTTETHDRVVAKREFQKWWVGKFVGHHANHLCDGSVIMSFNDADNDWLKETTVGHSVNEIVVQLSMLLGEIESAVKHFEETSMNLFS